MFSTKNDDFEARFKEYLNEQGPNPGTGWIAKMGWHTKKRNEFKKRYEELG